MANGGTGYAFTDLPPEKTAPGVGHGRQKSGSRTTVGYEDLRPPRASQPQRERKRRQRKSP